MSEEEPPGIKITLLGNPGVGKTCIITKYIDDTFNENNESTIGANYSEKTIVKDNKEYQLNIWDTAGQEKFHSLGKHFYKDSYVVVFVYDVTNQESLDALKSIWYPDLQKHGEKYTVLAVVGNKCDLFEKEAADEEQAKAFAKEINAFFILTSAKNGDGIEKLFATMTDKFLSPEFNPKYQELMRERGETKALKTKNNTSNEAKKKKCC